MTDWESALRDGVEPAETRHVSGERLVLPAHRPQAWRAGVALRGVRVGVRGQDTTPAPGAVDPDSVSVHDGRLDRDYFLDRRWGTLGAPAERAVVVDYRYSLLRVDSVVSAAGVTTLVRGRSHLTAPVPPPLPAGATRLTNVFVPYFSDGLDYAVFPIGTPAPRSVSTLDRLPRFAELLAHRQPVRVVCWGDSVTDGGDASSPEMAYPAVLRRSLRNPQVEVVPVAVGGSTSAQWIAGEAGCDWDRVAAERPDLVTVEFVNDAGLPAESWEPTYREILARAAALGAEVLLTTPHFTMPEFMGFDDIRAADPRPYTHFLREFAKRNSIALADISARWESLATEGLPYITLLANGINHPDDRGHALAADELLRCLSS